MKTTLPLTLALTGALITPLHAEEELAPPDVDFFVEAQVTKADMEPYGFDEDADGLTINVGMWLNSIDLGEKSRLGLEAGFVNQSDVSKTRQFRRPGTPSDNNADTVIFDQDITLEMSGITAGVVWQSPFWLYLKAGGYLYDRKVKQQQTRTLLDNTGTAFQTVNDAPETDSVSEVSPYMTAGIAIPVLDNLSLTAQYQYLESENFSTVGFGLRYSN